MTEFKETMTLQVPRGLKNKLFNLFRYYGGPDNAHKNRRTLNKWIVGYALPRFAKAEQRRQRRWNKKADEDWKELEMRSLHALALEEDEIRESLKLADRLKEGGMLTEEERERVERVLNLTVTEDGIREAEET